MFPRLPVMLGVLLAVLFGLVGRVLADEVCAIDDGGREVCLAAPAQRIASLSPGATELLFASGAGDRLVAVVDHSDFPPEAVKLPSVGSHDRLDLERLVTLQPDLVIAWVTGNPAEQVERLERLGVPVFRIEPRDFEGIATALERLARLAGSEAQGRQAAERFRQGLAELAARHADAPPVPVFYQVWDSPLMTVNDEHLIGKVVTLCGGVNVFGDLSRLVPRIGEEALLAADPEVLLAGGRGEENRSWLDYWRRYPDLTAVARDNLFFVPPSLLQRPTPRLLEGSRLLCEKLEVARGRR
ncbi:Vitamin B12-binding protein precursor [Halomonas lysinitropha]|uniref:Vitamin B12-binding protein n=2 Tax=Halomonas lysinitropha TaxID=2607506 RepID=A0A5K1I2E8_9GAMM|nr:cobalamin-binding protein [Halomonas lysinitropha]VVZ95615.1 Vitamin B12-binding protein precursor [Halomonas lysinitropha]